MKCESCQGAIDATRSYREPAKPGPEATKVQEIASSPKSHQWLRILTEHARVVKIGTFLFWLVGNGISIWSMTNLAGIHGSVGVIVGILVGLAFTAFIAICFASFDQKQKLPDWLILSGAFGASALPALTTAAVTLYLLCLAGYWIGKAIGAALAWFITPER